MTLIDDALYFYYILYGSIPRIVVLGLRCMFVQPNILVLVISRRVPSLHGRLDFLNLTVVSVSRPQGYPVDISVDILCQSL